ncbi:MAG: hypothetical protein OK456_07200 [Thaumarchaeota archaeon]|nr:hypothetical protein [Nitrososphaerota archaeon]
MSQPEVNPPTPAVQPSPQGRMGLSRQKVWVPIVVIVGFLLGEAISYLITQPQPTCFGAFPGEGGPCGPFGFNRFPRFNDDPTIQFHIILTTISIALLVALVVVYVRMYIETKANFALGLVVVLFALLVQALLSYPLLIGFIGVVYLGPGLSSQVADVFTVCAYIVFLYLSLE